MLNTTNKNNPKNHDVKSRFLSGKKTLLMLMLASMLVLSARGQVLQNTWWRAYDLSNIPDLYWHFGQDTLSYSVDGLSYINASVFSTAGNYFSILDLTTAQCALTDTGWYYFFINIDTLTFINIIDSCNSRHQYFISHYLINIPLGIEDINPISTATIYPNPSADGIFNLSFTGNSNLPKRIYVLSADGRKIMDENFAAAATNHTIHLQSFASGIYFLVMENENGRRVMKLVR